MAHGSFKQLGQDAKRLMFVPLTDSIVAPLRGTLPIPVHSDEFIYSFVTGLGGSPDLNIEPSLPSGFDYVSPEGISSLINRVNMVIIDNVMLNANDFAAIVGGLSSGIEIGVYNETGGQTLDFLDGQTITRNADWNWLAGVDTVLNHNDTSIASLSVRWTIERAGGSLILEPGEKFRITINDNLTGIIDFKAMVQGLQFSHD